VREGEKEGEIRRTGEGGGGLEEEEEVVEEGTRSFFLSVYFTKQ